MALSSPSTSLAARPRVRVGGMRGKNEDPNTFRQRMDGQAPTPGTTVNNGQLGQQQSTPQAANPLPNRRDNILASRSDGTFDAKRTAYNQQGQATGHSMDEAGNITAPPAGANPGGSLVPGSSPGSSVWKPNAPAATPPVQATLSTPATAPAGQPAAPTAANPLPTAKPGSPAPGAPPAQLPGTLPPSKLGAPPPGSPGITAATGLPGSTPIPALQSKSEIVAARMAKGRARAEGERGQPPPTTGLGVPRRGTLVSSELNAPGLPPGTPVGTAVNPLVANSATSNVTRNVTNNVTPTTSHAANKLAAFNAKHPNVLTGAAGVAQSDALAATRRQQIAAVDESIRSYKASQAVKLHAANTEALRQMEAQKTAPAPFTGPAGIAAAQKAVQQNHAERDATDLARYKAEDAANPGYNQQAQPSGQPYAFSRSGHGNAPTPQLPGRAKGGPVDAGKPYLVGEKGPEVVIPKTHPVNQAVLGVVNAGGNVVKGVAGLVSMAADSKLKEAADFDAGKSPAPENYTPIAERYKTDPWYKRIPKQVNDAMHMSTSNPQVKQQVKHNSGSWASAAKEPLKAIKQRADKEYADAIKTQSDLKPRLGIVGEATSFASSLIPGVRAMDIPLAIGAEKGLKGGIIPAIAMAATRKMPGGALAKNAAQQAISIAGARANGGPVQAQRPYLVGERGPEIVVPQQNATVIPNHAINPSAMPAVRSGKSFGSDWKASMRPPAMAKTNDWRTTTPPKIATNLLVSR